MVYKEFYRYAILNVLSQTELRNILYGNAVPFIVVPPTFEREIPTNQSASDDIAIVYFLAL